MKIGHFLNELALASDILTKYVQQYGIRGFIKNLFLELSALTLDWKESGLS